MDNEVEQNLRTFNEDDDYLVLELDGPLPRNVRRLRSVLMDLGVCNAETLMDSLARGAQADPLHLCRMIQNGLLHDEDTFGDGLRFIDLNMYIPIVSGEEHVGECSVDGVSNDVFFGRYTDSGDMNNIELVSQHTEDDILEYLRSESQEQYDDKVSLVNFFIKHASAVVKDDET